MATLHHLFFPNPQPADLTDTHSYNYPEPLEDTPEIAAAEVKEAIFKPTPDKAPGPDSIPHHILCLLYKDVAGYLQALFNTCLQQDHHPHCF